MTRFFFGKTSGTNESLRTRLLGLAACLLAVCMPVLADDLPLETREKLMKEQAIEAVKSGDSGALLVAMDEYRTLERLGVTIPAGLFFAEADSARSSGDPVRAERAFNDFFRVAPPEGEAFAEALRVYGEFRKSIPESVWPILEQMAPIPGRSADTAAGTPAIQGAPFSLSRRAVTRRQFEAFIKATDYRPQGQDGAGGCPGSPGPADDGAEAGAEAAAANDPVVCVSWIDADAYVEWLRQSSGLKFRLPTAAEWELAAYAAGSVAEPTTDSPTDSPAEVPPESPSEVSVGDPAAPPTGDALETLAEDAVANPAESPAESLAEGAVVSPVEGLADHLPESPAATAAPTPKPARIEHLSASRSEWVHDCATPAAPDSAQDRSEPCLKHVAVRYRPPGTSSEAAGDPRVVLGNGYRADNLGFRLAL
jgi:hypothetical protein